jgi:hypothetical protein
MFVINNVHPLIIWTCLGFLSITYLIITVGVIVTAVQMVSDFEKHIKSNGGVVPILFTILAALMTASCTIVVFIVMDFPAIYAILHP